MTRRIAFVDDPTSNVYGSSTRMRMLALANYFDTQVLCFWCNEHIPDRKKRCTCKLAVIFDTCWRDNA